MVCVPASQGTQTITAATFPVRPGPPLRVRSVTLADARRVAVRDSVFVLHGDNSIGYEAQYPPPARDLAAMRIDWSARLAARGARLLSTTRDRSYDLVLGVHALGAEAHFDHVEIRYTRDGADYVYRSGFSVQLLRPPRTCPGA